MADILMCAVLEPECQETQRVLQSIFVFERNRSEESYVDEVRQLRC